MKRITGTAWKTQGLWLVWLDDQRGNASRSGALCEDTCSTETLWTRFHNLIPGPRMIERWDEHESVGDGPYVTFSFKLGLPFRMDSLKLKSQYLYEKLPEYMSYASNQAGQDDPNSSEALVSFLP